MSTLFTSINTALQSLLTQQEAISTVQHNVANANTEGYHRQEAVMSASPVYGTVSTTTGTSFVGSGVNVESISRTTTPFYDMRFRNATSESSYNSTLQTKLSELESVLDETGDASLTSLMDEFWVSWQNLSSDPSNTSYRSALYDSAVSLADGINWREQTISDARQDVDTSIIDDVSQINSIASQLAEINGQIVAASSGGGEPNDLLDNRDKLLDQLSQLTNITATAQDNGSVIVSLDGHTLVMGTDTFKLETFQDAANDNLLSIRWTDGNGYTPTTGELGGLIAIAAPDGDLKNQLDGLNELASTLITQVNAVHRTGYDLNGNTNVDFFTGTNADDIGINEDLSDGSQIAAAASVDSSGDGSIALTISELQNALLMDGGTSTLNEYYNKQVTNLGLTISTAESNASSFQNVADSVDALRESTYGVSLDEEAANLVKYQTAYEAAARIMTAIDEMLNTIINGMGVVGR